MKAEQIIQKYHNLLSRALGCNQTPKFKIGEVVEVRKNVENIRHIGDWRDWIEWDKCREDIEGKRVEILEINYIDYEGFPDKRGCIGYRIKVEGRRGHIAVHEECLKKLKGGEILC